MKTKNEYLKDEGVILESDFSAGVYTKIRFAMEKYGNDYHQEQVKNNIVLADIMPCTTFEHTAVDLKDGSTAVWTDGLSLNSDNDIHCQYKLQAGQKYKVVLYKA